MIECPSCGRSSVERARVVHHMLCAYVGPLYDFTPEGSSYRCPKCHLLLNDGADDSEIVGYSYHCSACGFEQVEGYE